MRTKNEVGAEAGRRSNDVNDKTAKPYRAPNLVKSATLAQLTAETDSKTSVR